MMWYILVMDKPTYKAILWVGFNWVGTCLYMNDRCRNMNLPMLVPSWWYADHYWQCMHLQVIVIVPSLSVKSLTSCDTDVALSSGTIHTSNIDHTKSGTMGDSSGLCIIHIGNRIKDRYMHHRYIHNGYKHHGYMHHTRRSGKGGGGHLCVVHTTWVPLGKLIHSSISGLSDGIPIRVKQLEEEKDIWKEF